MARALADVLNSLRPMFDPQRAGIEARQAQLPGQEQEDLGFLEATKNREFENIKNDANANNMFYSGQPIEGQNRYVGERYMPAVTDLKRSYGERRNSLADAIRQLESTHYQTAYNMHQQELAKDEENRIYQQQQAAYQAQQRAAAAPRGGSAYRPGTAPAARPAAAPQVNYDAGNASTWLSAIDQVYRSNPKLGWGGVASVIESRYGMKIPRGSLADKAFNMYFNGQGKAVNSINQASGFRY